MELVGLLGDWMTAPGPLYRNLAGALQRAVELGDLAPGQRLHAERELARTLVVSRATVVAACDQLRSQGILDSRQGSGTRVASRPSTARAGADGRIPGGRAASIFQRLVDGPGELISLTMAVARHPCAGRRPAAAGGPGPWAAAGRPRLPPARAAGAAPGDRHPPQ
jgi:hypothetical protein